MSLGSNSGVKLVEPTASVIRSPLKAHVRSVTVSDDYFHVGKLGGALRSLKRDNKAHVSNARMYEFVSAIDGDFTGNGGELMFHNIERNKLVLSRYMMINDDGQLVRLEKGSFKSEEAAWNAFRVEHPQRAVFVTDKAIADGKKGKRLAFGVDKYGSWIDSLSSSSVGGSAKLIFDKLPDGVLPSQR